jgi:sugar phosphate isomerase/epimerase
MTPPSASRLLGPTDFSITASSLGSPPFRTMVEAASAAGFAGLSIWPEATYTRARADGWSDHDLGAILADHGMVVQDVDALVAWVGPDDPGGPYFIESPRDSLFAAARALGARFTNVLLVGPPGRSIDDTAEAFAGICDLAAEHDLIATYEFSYRGVVRTLTDAVAVIRAAGRPNGRLLIDTWHYHFGGSDLAALSAVPGEMVAAVQLNDVAAEAPADIVDASLHHRLPPGEGIVGVTDFVRTLQAIGSPAPLTVEVFNDDLLAAHGPHGFAAMLADGLRTIVADASAKPAEDRG